MVKILGCVLVPPIFIDLHPMEICGGLRRQSMPACISQQAEGRMAFYFGNVAIFNSELDQEMTNMTGKPNITLVSVNMNQKNISLDSYLPH